MTNAELFMYKINIIDERLDYVVDNWELDPSINTQEIRFALALHLYNLYENYKVKNLADTYLQKIDERKRVGSETLLTAVAAASVINEDVNRYFEKLKNLINKKSDNEKKTLIIQFLIILTPEIFKKFKSKNKEYIEALVEKLNNQDTEERLFYFWTKKRLFYSNEKIDVPVEEIRCLKEYLVWEIASIEKYDDVKMKLRKKFIPEISEYNFDKIDLIAFLTYQFIKKNKIHIITETELNEKVNHQIRTAIGKKVIFPLICSIIFMWVKISNTITVKTIEQIILLILGTILLLFEERLGSFEIPIKKTKISFGEIGELLVIISVLWAANLISLIKIMLQYLF